MDRRRIILKPEGANDATGYGTFKRITEKDHGSMPSVIRFGGGSYQDRKSTAYTIAGDKITYKIPGTIGDDDLEFHVEFDENLSISDADDLEKFTNSANMKIDLENDEYAAYPIGALLDGFVIYEVDDASYQAMSVLNYDFFPKVFAKIDDATKKIIGKAVCVLKSYTLKKAWIMIDKKVSVESGALIEHIADNIIDTIILDAGIILTKAEKSNDSASRFQSSIGLHSNLCGMLSDPATYSPINDMIQDAAVKSYSSESARSFSIHKQAGYFRQMTANADDSASKQRKYNIRTLDSNDSVIAKPLQPHTIGDTKQNHIYVSGDIVKNYVGRRCYDIYKIENGYFENRVLLSTDANDDTLEYEVFAFIATYARYVFKYAADDITADDIRNDLINGSRFMCKYDLHYSELFKFTYASDANAKYVEVLIPICDDNSNRTDDDPNENDLTAGITMQEISFGNDTSYPFGISIGSKYSDPGNVEYTLPYIYANKYAADYYGDSVPSIHSDELNMFELRQFDAHDKIFDILPGSVFSDETSEAVHIDGDSVINALKTAGYRDPDATNPGIFEKDEEARDTIADNLALMAFGPAPDASSMAAMINQMLINPSSIGESCCWRKNDIDLSEYSFAFGRFNKGELLTRTISSGVYAIHEIMPPTYSVDAYDYYIIPTSVSDGENVVKVSFDREMYVIY